LDLIESTKQEAGYERQVTVIV